MHWTLPSSSISLVISAKWLHKRSSLIHLDFTRPSQAEVYTEEVSSPALTITFKLNERKDMKKLLLGALAAAAMVVVPGVSMAATYAYVNTAGEVMTTEATSGEAAILSAPGIHIRSGVLLIDDASDSAVVGNDVSGV